ncbi:MAG: hypothetical protein KGJ40_03910 [candidate division NC10 bacterium]|nr:hypothetical protein [candidate division NC10 bacterium]
MEKYLKVGMLLTLMTLLSSIAHAVPRELFEEWSLDLRDSISYLEKEIEAHPDNYRLRFVLGTLYFELGVAKIDTNTNEVAQASLLMLDKAEKEFKEVLQLKKNDSMSYYYLGHIAMQKNGNMEQAIDYYKKAIENDKHNSKAYIKLHYLYLAGKKYKSAVEVLENAKRYFKGDAIIYHRLGLT